MNKILTLVILLFFNMIVMSANVTVLNLNQNWEFTESGKDQWLPAVVPGTVHQDLLRHKLIPNPFWGTNESKIQWVEEKDWDYRTSFDISKEQLKIASASLFFEGLDTYADVFLNGSLVLSSDNMFVGYQVPVHQVLREGKNMLHVRFYSPINKTIPQHLSDGFNYPADNDHHDKKLSVYTRKAPYSYGWDWGIRMVTSGVWRPVSLRFVTSAQIQDVHVVQTVLTDRQAQTANHVVIKNVLSFSLPVKIKLEYLLKNKTVFSETKEYTLIPGSNSLTMNALVESPQKWMPAGWGDPTLYDVKVQVIDQDQQILHQDQLRFGFRTVRLVNEPDNHGQSFYFEVNGQPMYAKGANYIPQDAMLPSVTDDRYRELFHDIRAANMNMVRVWGGGTYESDLFYDLADENGILVWQDFLFGCTTYPHDPAFLKRVEEETTYNIKRLRNHACLAMWCGNNEILEGMHYWGWEKRYNPAIYKEMFAGYDSLFRKLLPQQVSKFDNGRSYIHGSPLSANWGKPESWPFGDSHNWGVWYGKKTFESFNTETGRFMSEFGFQSFPEMKTIASFADSSQWSLESEVMNAHQKSSIGNSLIKTYMERDFLVPAKFEDFVYVGLVLQGKGMRYGLEAQRRNKPYCMGSLYWQLNDSWPVVSWSGIDYFGNWKALHYDVSRAFAPILISPYMQGDTLMVYLISDLLQKMPDVRLQINWTDFSGKIVRKEQMKTDLAANVSMKVKEQKLSDVFSQERLNEVFADIQLYDNQGNEINRQIFFPSKTKDLKLPDVKIFKTLRFKNGQIEVTLKTDKLAKDVFVEIPLQGARFSDNFFDLLPGETKIIRISSPLIEADNTYQIQLNHIKNTYN